MLQSVKDPENELDAVAHAFIPAPRDWEAEAGRCLWRGKFQNSETLPRKRRNLEDSNNTVMCEAVS